MSWNVDEEQCGCWTVLTAEGREIIKTCKEHEEEEDRDGEANT